jgi:hypothetical protein
MNTEVGAYVEYHEEQGILRCISHKYDMTPGEGVMRHFQRHHGSISLGIRNKIIKYAASAPLKDPKDVRPPNPDADPVEGFEVIENGFKCTFEGCLGYYCPTLSTIKKHCINMHECHEEKWTRQAIQTFFQGISLNYYTNIRPELQLLPCDDASNCYSDCNGRTG